MHAPLRLPLLGALATATLLSSCGTPSMGIRRPSAPPVVAGSANFSAAEFAWSQRAGANIIAGRVAYRQGGARYTCVGSSVVLTPETAWSSRRMTALYGSSEQAALPSDEVRARTPRAPPGDAGPYVRRTTCDEADQFAFGNLPDGAWYAITIVRAVGDAKAPSMALMKRVVVRGGRTVAVAL